MCLHTSLAFWKFFSWRSGKLMHFVSCLNLTCGLCCGFSLLERISSACIYFKKSDNFTCWGSDSHCICMNVCKGTHGCRSLVGRNYLIRKFTCSVDLFIFICNKRNLSIPKITDLVCWICGAITINEYKYFVEIWRQTSTKLYTTKDPVLNILPRCAGAI